MTRRSRAVRAVLAAIVAWLASQPANSQTIAAQGHSVEVVDGDTITLNGHLVDLQGIDAPELMQTCLDGHGAAYACGRDARAALRGIVGGRAVVCTRAATEARDAAYCTVHGIDINAYMVGQGWALPAPDVEFGYQVEVLIAETARLGVWQGRFTEPWVWRGR